MKDSGHLELDWLLSCKLEELIASVRPMSAKSCEQYARAILGRIGGPSFEQLLMRIVETMVPRDGRGPPTNSDEYYFAIRDLFPHVPAEPRSFLFLRLQSNQSLACSNRSLKLLGSKNGNWKVPGRDPHRSGWGLRGSNPAGRAQRPSPVGLTARNQAEFQVGPERCGETRLAG